MGKSTTTGLHLPTLASPQVAVLAALEENAYANCVRCVRAGRGN
jgi:hypothetical protein